MTSNADDELEVEGVRLSGLGAINVLLGKNGCGKSRLLRKVDSTKTPGLERKRYISPERGGSLVYHPGVDQNIATQPPAWLSDQRRRNQTSQFREQARAQFARLELTVLRRDSKREFERQLAKINGLLDNVRIHTPSDEGRAGFDVSSKDGRELKPEDLSSGESELITMGIECLEFEATLPERQPGLLLLDEPDVHIHPDLQSRLMKLLVDIVTGSEIRVLIATHSTAIIGALAARASPRASFMKAGARSLWFRPVSEVVRRVVPVFGAHPLSEVFGQSPLLLVEGDDDERVWQQAVRSSAGNLRVYPVSCGGKGNLSEYEREANELIGSVYDDARAYSLRDGDGIAGEVNDLEHVRRLRLSCRAAENLMLTDDVLLQAGTSWEALRNRLAKWRSANAEHEKAEHIDELLAAEDRLQADLKHLRNIVAGMLHASKPWEVLVGQVIAGVDDTLQSQPKPSSLHAALGDDVMAALTSWRQRTSAVAGESSVRTQSDEV